MKRSTAIALGIGAAVLVGGGIVLAFGGPRKAKRTIAEFAAPLNGGRKTANTGTGLTVGRGCRLDIYDLDRAKATAYRLGRTTRTFDAARVGLYGAGCEPGSLDVPKTQMRSHHLILAEVLRGAVATGKVLDHTAAALLRDSIFTMALAGVDITDMPGDV